MSLNQKPEVGHGVSVVTPAPEHTFSLDEDALRHLLLRDDVKDLPAVVVSVAGAFRKGKSFILDFFLRYLRHKYTLKSTNEDWLGAEDVPLRGFNWRGGSERDTTGLLLWSEPFIATTDHGEKVVIYLMDTQGTFDSESTVRDNATVFALSTMLSSVQIYNISQNIEEDDLQHLQLFTDYGRLAQESDEKVTRKPFQHLQLLVRDWSYPYEYEYGAKGGEKLLKKRLEIQDGQHPQLQSLRRHVTSCFDHLYCFLLPHPGMTVATNPNFDGRLKDIDAEFISTLRELVPMLLAPENLVPKLIEGQKVKAKDLLIYFQAYMNVFNGTELPEPKSILAATAEANNLSALAGAREVYTTLMEAVCGGTHPQLSDARLRDEHQRARDKAVYHFQAARKMGGDDIAAGYRDRLMQELEKQYTEYVSHNAAKGVLSVLGAAIVLLALMMLAGVVAACGRVLGVVTLETVGGGGAVCAAGLLMVWAYTRATGNMREIGMQIDAFAYSARQIFFSLVTEERTELMTSQLDKKMT